MRSRGAQVLVVLVALLGGLVAVGAVSPAQAHEERPAGFPDGTGRSRPSIGRPGGEVCGGGGPPRAVGVAAGRALGAGRAAGSLSQPDSTAPSRSGRRRAEPTRVPMSRTIAAGAQRPP